MSRACTPVLVGVASSVSEIWLPFKNGQISLDYSPWSSKYLINWNRLKKFMQVGIDVKCMHTSFGRCGFFAFGDITTFKNDQISLLGPWSSKNLIDRNRLKKFMQVGIDVTYMHTSFGRCNFFSFEDMATFQKWPNFPFQPWTIVHGHRKI